MGMNIMSYFVFLLLAVSFTHVASSGITWKTFSKQNPLRNFAVNFNGAVKETFLMRFSCNDPMRFKLHLQGESGGNSNIEMMSKTYGYMYCKGAGSKSYYGGERWSFSSRLTCNENTDTLILRIEKTSTKITISNEGREIYKRDFVATDGRCSLGTKKVTTDLWNEFSDKLALAVVTDISIIVDGGWSDFGDWSKCSVTCGGGTQTRTKTCTNPAPANWGAHCQGQSAENRTCNTLTCPDSSAVSICSIVDCVAEIAFYRLTWNPLIIKT